MYGHNVGDDVPSMAVSAQAVGGQLTPGGTGVRPTGWEPIEGLFFFKVFILFIKSSGGDGRVPNMGDDVSFMERERPGPQAVVFFLFIIISPGQPNASQVPAPYLLAAIHRHVGHSLFDSL